MVRPCSPFSTIFSRYSHHGAISKLLKPTTTKNKEVYWDTQLQTLFEKAKEICKLSSNGLAYYDIKKNTVVITDWSKQGIGFVVMQQHCS